MNIAELETGGVIVTTFAGGSSAGIRPPQPCFAISTADRIADRDHVVLTRQEAVLVALAILLDEERRRKHNGAATKDLAELFEVDLKNLKAFE